MTAIHAFMRRDWFTCAECGNRRRGECTEWDRPIRWDPKGYGCGQYVTRLEGYQLTLDAYDVKGRLMPFYRRAEQ